MADGAAKLQQLVQVCVDNSAVGIKEHVTARTQDLAIQIGQLELQMKAIATALADGATAGKKTRAKKADAAPAGDAAATPAGDAAPAGEAAAPAAEVAGKKFATNSYNWFTAKFKADAEFRAKHLTAANLDLMKNDEVISKKKTDAEKMAPQAKFLWTHYKIKDPAVHKELTAQYDAEKEAHEKAGKPAQQSKEANSPVVERK